MLGLENHQLTVIEGNDMKAVQQLSLVLVDTFHLTVKHGVNVNSDAIVMLDVTDQCLLVSLNNDHQHSLQFFCP